MTRASDSESDETPDPDDWDHHWAAYGEAAQTNPANRYRRDLLMRLIGRPVAGSTMLDIGSGQGEFALYFARTYPDLTVWGVEHSAAGVRRARLAARSQNLNVRFLQRDLLKAVPGEPELRPAGYATCSEVLEHVDDPARLMHNAAGLLAPGCRVVVTVPGGPRSAFDRHIGHHRHFRPAELREVLVEAGYRVDRVLQAGFPFFNLYKLAVIARGKRLITAVENRSADTPPTGLEARAVRLFDSAFRRNRDDSRFGWQLAAVAHLPGPDAE